MKNLDYAEVSSANVKKLLELNRMSIRHISEIIEVAPTTLNDSLKSKKGISIDNLIKIADFFNVTVNDLCNPEFISHHSDDVVSADELINKFGLIDEYGKVLVSSVLDLEYKRCKDTEQYST